jgi:hypothetical protein
MMTDKQVALWQNVCPPYDPAMVSDPARNNHGGDAGSELAWQTCEHSRYVELSYSVIVRAGRAGCTLEEVTKELGVTVPTTRPRFTSLLKDGRIKKTRQRRRSQLGGRARVCMVFLTRPPQNGHLALGKFIVGIVAERQDRHVSDKCV